MNATLHTRPVGDSTRPRTQPSDRVRRYVLALERLRVHGVCDTETRAMADLLRARLIARLEEASL